MDEIAIKTACASVRSARGSSSPENLTHPPYCGACPAPPALEFSHGNFFRFPSAVNSSSPENNRVFGRLFPGASERRRKEGRGPAVVFLHGWNGEQGYRLLFPWMGRRCARLGLTAAMIELPYHGSRKPPRHPRNFLSGDIEHMMGAAQQAIADIRAMVSWLRAEGYGPVGLWGVSLGAWLGGLVTCFDERIGAAVLVTPVSRIDRAIENLAFCSHIRSSMKGRDISASELNLTYYLPKPAPENVLIVESVYDLFAPANSLEELWNEWGRPEIWRVKHGHISVLLSIPVMSGTCRWLGRRLKSSEGNGG